MYQEFAKVYDRLQDVDYEAFVDYYESLFQRFGCHPRLMLDLACGTGNITIPMARRGYDMIGVDLSPEMLDLAAQKAREQGTDILFLNQDMSDFELYGTVDAIVCALDGVNYLIEHEDVEHMFRLARNYLNPGGLLIFDVNTLYKLEHVLGDNTFVYDLETVFCVWDNCYDPQEKICGFDLNFFVRQQDGRFVRFQEYQEERGYKVQELTVLLHHSGLEVLGIFDELTQKPPSPESQRLFFVARRPVE